MIEANGIKAEFHIHLGPIQFWRKKGVYTKDNVRILFIDDNEWPVIKSLERAGYRVRHVSDVSNIDDPEIRESQILFVDYDGVGHNISPLHQGAGLVKVMKEEYKKTKYLVLYTAQSVFSTDTAIGGVLEHADATMRKGSDVSDFIDRINVAIKYLNGK